MRLKKMTAGLYAWIGLISSNSSIKTVILPQFCIACLSGYLLMYVYFDLVNIALQTNSKRESKLNVAALITCNFPL